jgi:hypothetical protein
MVDVIEGIEKRIVVLQFWAVSTEKIVQIIEYFNAKWIEDKAGEVEGNRKSRRFGEGQRICAQPRRKVRSPGVIAAYQNGSSQMFAACQAIDPGHGVPESLIALPK